MSGRPRHRRSTGAGDEKTRSACRHRATPPAGLGPPFADRRFTRRAPSRYEPPIPPWLPTPQLLLLERTRHPPSERGRGGGALLRGLPPPLAARGDEITLLAAGFPGAPRGRESCMASASSGSAHGSAYYLQRRRGGYRRLRRAPRRSTSWNEQTNKFPYFARLWVAGAPGHLDPSSLPDTSPSGRSRRRSRSRPSVAEQHDAAHLSRTPGRRGSRRARATSSSQKGFPAADVHVIPNAVDHAAYRPTSDRARPYRPSSRLAGSSRPRHARADRRGGASPRRPPRDRRCRQRRARPAGTDRAPRRRGSRRAPRLRPRGREDPPHADGARLRVGLGEGGLGALGARGRRVRNPDASRATRPASATPSSTARPACSHARRRPGVVRGGDPTPPRRSRRARERFGRRPRARRLVQLGRDRRTRSRLCSTKRAGAGTRR